MKCNYNTGSLYNSRTFYKDFYHKTFFLILLPFAYSFSNTYLYFFHNIASYTILLFLHYFPAISYYFSDTLFYVLNKTVWKLLYFFSFLMLPFLSLPFLFRLYALLNTVFFLIAFQLFFLQHILNLTCEVLLCVLLCIFFRIL